MEATPNDHRQSSKLASIQFLRAIAVMLVVYMHSLDLQPHARQQGFLFLAGFGAVGVDIFFVISGFIITWSAGRYQGRHDAGKFLYHRFRRLIPVYWLATLLFLIVQVRYILRPGAAGLHSIPFIIKTIFLLPLADKSSFILPFLSVAWTLSFEWLFYLLFFAGILFSKKRMELFLCGWIGLLVLAGILLQPPDARLNLLTNPILLEFALGALICGCYTRFCVCPSMATLLLWSGVAGFAYGIIFGFGHIGVMANIVNSRLSIPRFLYWGIPSALLVAGCLFLEKNRRGIFIWDSRLFALIGNASYSIYLTHLSIYGLCILAYDQWGPFPYPDGAVVLQWVLAIAAGIVFYRLVEQPLLRHKKRPDLSGR